MNNASLQEKVKKGLEIQNNAFQSMNVEGGVHATSIKAIYALADKLKLKDTEVLYEIGMGEGLMAAGLGCCLKKVIGTDILKSFDQAKETWEKRRNIGTSFNSNSNILTNQLKRANVEVPIQEESAAKKPRMLGFGNVLKKDSSSQNENIPPVK